MSTREGKSRSVLTRTVGKALADVLNNRPVPHIAAKATAPTEFGVGGGGSKSGSTRRSSLPQARGTVAASLGRGSPPSSQGGRTSRSSLTPTVDKKLAPLPEEKEMPPPRVPSKARGRLSKSPKLQTGIQPSALPKYRPKMTTATAAATTTATSKMPPSPVRFVTRKRRTSEDSGSATQASSSTLNEPVNVPTLSLSPPGDDKAPPRPISPLPKRAAVAKKSGTPVRPSPSPSPSPQPQSKPVAKPSSAAKENVSKVKDDRSPLKRLTRRTPTTSKPSPQSTLRPPSASSTPSKSPSPNAPLKKKTPTPGCSSKPGGRSPAPFSPDSIADAQEVSFLLSAVASPTKETPALPRLRLPGTLPRTPASLNARMSYLASPLGTRGSILSWEDVSRNIGADELGLRLTDVSAPFTPRDRTVSVFSDASMTGMSDAWGASPRTSAVGLATPGLSISQVLFPTPPNEMVNAAADASFGDVTIVTPARDADMADAEDSSSDEFDDDEGVRLFAPSRDTSPDEKQAAVLLLQMQLAALEGVREERDALREERAELEDMRAERDALREELEVMARTAAERDARDAEAAAARHMQEEVAQEERAARVAADERASAEAQRATAGHDLARAEAARAALTEWRALTEMLHAELERVRSDREVLQVVQNCATAAVRVCE